MTTVSEEFLPTPVPSPRRSPVSTDEDAPITSIYLNLDFPVPTREWEGVFDIWVKGDAQDFANVVRERMETEARIKQAALERKRKREEMEEQGLVPDAKKKKLPGPSKPSSSTRKQEMDRSSSPVPVLNRRKIKIICDEVRKVTRLTSSSDDEHDGYPEKKIYLRIPRRPVPVSPPPIASPTPMIARFLTPQVIIERTPASLSYAKEWTKHRPIVALPTPTPSPTPLTEFFPQKKRGDVSDKNSWSQARKLYAAKKVEDEATAAQLSSELVRNVTPDTN